MQHKHLPQAADKGPISYTRDMVVRGTCAVAMQVRLDVPKAFDLSANAFAGVFPAWLVTKVAAAPEYITANMSVSAQMSASWLCWQACRSAVCSAV